MSEKKRLLDRLFSDPERKTINFHIFPGSGPFTEEELCAEINRALDAHAEGKLEAVTLDRRVKRTTVREFLGPDIHPIHEIGNDLTKQTT